MTVGRHEMKQVSGLGDQIIAVRCIQRDFIGVAKHRVIGSDALHLSVHTIKGKVGELHSVRDPVGDGVAPHRPNDYARAERDLRSQPVQDRQRTARHVQRHHDDAGDPRKRTMAIPNRHQLLNQQTNYEPRKEMTNNGTRDHR